MLSCLTGVVLLFILFIGVTQSAVEYTSKACYGNAAICTSHHLSCNSGTIAVYGAYYTQNSQCTRDGLVICNIDVKNLTETGTHCDFNQNELDSLYSECSAKSQCEYRARRRSADVAFSVVKYACIKGSHQMCAKLNEHNTTDAAVIWKGGEVSSGPREYSICPCSITQQGSMGSIDIHALDMRLNFNTTIQSCGEVFVNNIRFNCSSQIIANRLLLNNSVSHYTAFGIRIQEPNQKDLVWIRVQGTEPFSLECPASYESSTVADDVTRVSSSPSTTISIPETTPYTERKDSSISKATVSSRSTIQHTSVSTVQSPSVPGTTHLTGISPTVTDQVLNTGTLIGALVPSVLIIAGVSLFIVVFCLKRKKQRRVKEENMKHIMDSRSQDMHSLAGGIPDNLYLELDNQPDDYDYATADGLASSKETYYTKAANGDQKHIQENREGDYDHVGDKSFSKAGDYYTTASVTQKAAQRGMTSSGPEDKDVYSYDHLNASTDAGHNNATHSSDYDTTSSSTKAVADLESKECSPKEDTYSYNHLGGNKQVKTMQNEYATSASAANAIAQLSGSVVEENDYDHVEKSSQSKLLTSPYDTAGKVRNRLDDYSLAGNITKNNPCDLAK